MKYDDAPWHYGAAGYFDFEKGQYLADYESVLREKGRDLYYVADTWENFDRLKPVLDRRYADWKAGTGTTSG